MDAEHLFCNRTLVERLTWKDNQFVDLQFTICFKKGLLIYMPSEPFQDFTERSCVQCVGVSCFLWAKEAQDWVRGVAFNDWF